MRNRGLTLLLTLPGLLSSPWARSWSGLIAAGRASRGF